MKKAKVNHAVCPNCATLVPLEKRAYSRKNYTPESLEAVKSWEATFPQGARLPWLESGKLFEAYKLVADTYDLPELTQRRFSATLLALGWEYKRTSASRLYRRPKPFGEPLTAPES